MKILYFNQAGNPTDVLRFTEKEKPVPVQFFNSQIIYKNLEIKGFGIRSFLQMQSKVQRNEMVQTLIEEISKPSFELPVAGLFLLNSLRKRWLQMISAV